MFLCLENIFYGTDRGFATIKDFLNKKKLFPRLSKKRSVCLDYILKPFDYIKPGLPDGFFSNQKNQFG
jgi:hypothetical protein